jgi:type VI secretion system secreted protein Hcp
MAFDAFLKLDGIKGEGAGGTITLESFSWGVSNSSSAATGGAGSGKASFQDFSFSTVAGTESADLLLACASGQHIASGQLSIMEKASPLITITFSDVIISSYKIDQMNLKLDNAATAKQSPKLGPPIGNVSFNFSKFVFQTHGSSSSGSTNGNPG